MSKFSNTIIINAFNRNQYMCSLERQVNQYMCSLEHQVTNNCEGIQIFRGSGGIGVGHDGLQ